MPQSLSQHLTQKLIDWLIAFFGATLCLWFVITQPVFFKQPQQALQNIETKQLKEHVQLLTGGYAPRTINYNHLNSVADYIYRQFAVIGIPEYQNIKTISREYRNVSLKLGPDTEEVYVIGAHYDAENDSIDTEGNASGVATLIELARHLAENNNKLEIGVILVAYPLSLNQTVNIVDTGSYFHADSLKRNNKKVRLMISLDSVGQRNIQNMSQSKQTAILDYLNPKNKNSVNLIGRLEDYDNIRALKKGFEGTTSLSLSSHNLLENFNKTQSSDHKNYWNQGYPAVLISDAEGGRDGVAQRNEQPINSLDYGKMGMLVSGLSQVILKTRAKGRDKTRLAQQKSEITRESLF